MQLVLAGGPGEIVGPEPIRGRQVRLPHPKGRWVRIRRTPVTPGTPEKVGVDMAMGCIIYGYIHFGVDEHPFATYFDVHQG